MGQHNGEVALHLRLARAVRANRAWAVALSVGVLVGAVALRRSGAPARPTLLDAALASSLVLAVAVGAVCVVTAERAAALRARRHADRTDTLLRLGQEALVATSVAPFLEGAVDRLGNVLGAPLAEVLQLSHDGTSLVVVAGTGWWTGLVGAAADAGDERTLVGYTLAQGAPVVVPDHASKTRFEASELLRSNGIRSDVTTVIRTAHGPWGVLGVHDVAARAFDAEDVAFVAGVAHMIGAVVDRVDAMQRLERLSTHDGLTGLPNRSLLLDRLRAVVTDARRRGCFTAVVHVGFDRFGLVNETFGHAVGDAALVVVGARLAELVRSGDTVARYGGDEFVLVAVVERPDHAAELAGSVIAAVQAPVVLGQPPSEVFLSASVGVAVANGVGDAETLLRHAAAAGAQAEANGGGRYEFHDEALRRRAVLRLSEERDLRRALAAHEFVPYYQPVVRMEDGALVGAEALARWRHPARGLLGPDEFIDRATECRLIIELGDQLLRQALSEARAWRLPPGFTLAVNIAGAQMADDRLVGSLRQALTTIPFDPHVLALEVVEDDLGDLDAAARVVHTVKHAMGVRVYVDDFGTGQSSLARLHALAVDGLKIDRSFVAQVDTDPEARAIAGTIIDLARSLDLDVIAEGVETHGQRDTLRRLGCTLAQGWLFSPAVPAAAMAHCLEQAPVEPPAPSPRE